MVRPAIQSPASDPLLDSLADLDHRVAADSMAQEIAARLAEEVRVLVAYAICEGDVTTVEHLARGVGTAAMEDALRAVRGRAGA